MYRISLFIIYLIFALPLKAQHMASENRYSFGKTYIGTEFMIFPSVGSSPYLNTQGVVDEFERSGFFIPAINIGATHFWGHADFFVNLSTRTIRTGSTEIDHSFAFRAMTGVKVYPWAIKDHTIRPFLGYKFAPIRLNQEDISGQDFRLTRVKSLLELGATYRSPSLYAYVGYNMILDQNADIFLSRTQPARSTFPSHYFGVSVNYMIETTSGAYSEPVKKMDEYLRQNNDLGFFAGIGPSSAWPTRSSAYIDELYPYLDDLSMADVFPEFTMGYHFTKQDFIISANFRPIRQERAAFGRQLNIQRNSIGVEAYKFLFDYHGFAPFIGGGASYESIRFKEYDADSRVSSETFNEVTPSIIFGWDIRPGRLADAWMLRTNLRYSPTLDIQNMGRSLSLQFIEFNFIQLVIYPQRIKAYRDEL